MNVRLHATSCSPEDRRDGGAITGRAPRMEMWRMKPIWVRAELAAMSAIASLPTPRLTAIKSPSRGSNETSIACYANTCPSAEACPAPGQRRPHRVQARHTTGEAAWLPLGDVALGVLIHVCTQLRSTILVISPSPNENSDLPCRSRMVPAGGPLGMSAASFPR